MNFKNGDELVWVNRYGSTLYIDIVETNRTHTSIIWSCPRENTFNVDYTMLTKELDNYEGLRKITKLEKALK